MAVQWLRPWALTREMYAQRGVLRVTQELENLGNQEKYRKTREVKSLNYIKTYWWDKTRKKV